MQQEVRKKYYDWNASDDYDTDTITFIEKMATEVWTAAQEANTAKEKYWHRGGWDDALDAVEREVPEQMWGDHKIRKPDCSGCSYQAGVNNCRSAVLDAIGKLRKSNEK